jgi:hypothetical protein
MVATNETLLSPAFDVDYLFDHVFDPHEKQFKSNPHGFIMTRVLDSFEADAEMVGFLIGITAWENYFNNIAPEGANGIVCVVKSTCGPSFTYELHGPKPVFVGDGDLYDEDFHDYGRSAPIEKVPEGLEGLCSHSVTIYPSKESETPTTKTKTSFTQAWWYSLFSGPWPCSTCTMS